MVLTVPVRLRRKSSAYATGHQSIRTRLHRLASPRRTRNGLPAGWDFRLDLVPKPIDGARLAVGRFPAKPGHTAHEMACLLVGLRIGLPGSLVGT